MILAGFTGMLPTQKSAKKIGSNIMQLSRLDKPSAQILMARNEYIMQERAGTKQFLTRRNLFVIMAIDKP